MKKAYVFLAALMLSAGSFAQVTNGGFENWSAQTTGFELDDWSETVDTLLDQGYTCTTNALGAIRQGSGSPEGTSHLIAETSIFNNGADVLEPGVASLITIGATVATSFDYQYRVNLVAGDSALVVCYYYDGSFTLIGAAEQVYTSADNSSTFASESLSFIGSTDGAIATIIGVYSSYSLDGTEEEGSMIEIDGMSIVEATPASPATNVVGTDISDNADGSDLEVTFTAAADESTVAEYRVVAAATGVVLTPWDQAAVPYVSVTPDGSATYTVNFTGTQYVDDTPAVVDIVEDVEMDIVVVSMPGGSADVLSAVTSAATVTLTQTANVAEYFASNIFAYPNPSNDVVNFNIGTNDVDQIRIVDITGRNVMNISVNNSVETISVSDYQNGVYFYQIISGGKVVKTSKFIVSK